MLYCKSNTLYCKDNFLFSFFSCDLTYLLFLDSLELCCNFATFN
nr:MAG TPA: hypothetical protein [Bacteriophage sp.]